MVNIGFNDISPELAIVVVGSFVSNYINYRVLLTIRERDIALKRATEAEAERSKIEQEYRDKVDEHDRKFTWLDGRGFFGINRFNQGRSSDDFNRD